MERRIVYFADASNIHTRRWVSHFARKGYEAHVFSFQEGEIPNATVHFIDAGHVGHEGGNWRYLLHLPTLRRQLHCLQPALLHAHYLTSYGLLGALSAYRPLILTAWGSDVLVTPRRLWVYRVLLRFTLARADLVTSDAEVMSQKIVSYGLPVNRLLTIPLGVDSRLFYAEGRDWPTCGSRLINTRFLVPNSNLETVLAALGKARHLVESLSLTVAGDGPERPRLEAQARQLGVDTMVDWRGSVSHGDLPGLLREADLYLALTLSDSTSVSLLEAMACGVFPIVSDLPANREWIEHGLNGLLLPPDGTRALAAAIVQVARDPTMRKRAAQHNIGLINERGNWEKSMNRVEKFYKELC